MDYLSVLYQLRIVLFCPTSASFVSPLSSPQRRAATLFPELNPPPVAMSLFKLVYSDQYSAYNITDHIVAYSRKTNTQDQAAAEAAAELLAWEQIDRAKMFARAVGRWFEVPENKLIDPEELRELAAQQGLGIEYPHAASPVAAKTALPATATGDVDPRQHQHHHHHHHGHQHSNQQQQHVHHSASSVEAQAAGGVDALAVLA